MCLWLLVTMRETLVTEEVEIEEVVDEDVVVAMAVVLKLQPSDDGLSELLTKYCATLPG